MCFYMYSVQVVVHLVDLQINAEDGGVQVHVRADGLYNTRFEHNCSLFIELQESLCSASRNEKITLLVITLYSYTWYKENRTVPNRIEQQAGIVSQTDMPLSELGPVFIHHM
jgi:hypothetical protein